MQKMAGSVWTREKRQAKAPTLGREQIVREAIALLDGEGADALSMRRLAARLKSGATSLYWHVANKDELLDLVLDEVYGELKVPLDEEGLRWRDVVQRFAYSMRDTLARHLWAVPLVGSRPAIGPNALRAMSHLTGALRDAGFAGYNVDYAASSVTVYVLGWALSEVSWQRMLAQSGGDPRAVVAEMGPLFEKAAEAANYPELLEGYQRMQSEDPTVIRALAFEFGLVSLLDGLAVRLEQQELPKRGKRPARR
ncbi:TetR/AcrR family transcriptional regulator [Allorhizocola rhizosphaerae]|uniref:TetR/AcrR family transcriptional regulator n=1 Tax=Allorhizocola rhizosphaerae TaxID=1872709 RepID=UPI000E3CE2D6|nr:TetR/AcrR family transcriptional regulator [Allorhizocola rhizosphaerae]